MPPQHAALLVHKITGDKLHPAVAHQKFRVAAPGNEADVLAVRPSGAGKSGAGRHRADFRLAVISRRQQQPAELPLGEGIEEIALILFPVLPPQELPAAGGRLPVHPGVVPGGDAGNVQLIRPAQQRVKLDGPVALHAGIGRASGAVALHKLVHDAAPELLSEVKDIVIDSQAAGRAPGVLHRLQGCLLYTSPSPRD